MIPDRTANVPWTPLPRRLAQWHHTADTLTHTLHYTHTKHTTYTHTHITHPTHTTHTKHTLNTLQTLTHTHYTHYTHYSHLLRVGKEQRKTLASVKQSHYHVGRLPATLCITFGGGQIGTRKRVVMEANCLRAGLVCVSCKLQISKCNRERLVVDRTGCIVPLYSEWKEEKGEEDITYVLFDKATTTLLLRCTVKWGWFGFHGNLRMPPLGRLVGNRTVQDRTG